MPLLRLYHLSCEHVKWIKLYLHLICLYLYFVFIKISSSLDLILEWFWSIVKLWVFQGPNNCLKNRTFYFKILKDVKIKFLFSGGRRYPIRSWAESFLFQREYSPIRGRGRGNSLRGDLYPSACYDTGRGNPVMAGVHSDGSGSILWYIGVAHYNVEINKIGLHRGKGLLPFAPNKRNPDMCIIICLPVCDGISFEIKLNFLVKSFLTWPSS